jgi:hypothetical protein
MFRLIVVKLSQKSLHLSLLSSTYPCELSVRKFFDFFICNPPPPIFLILLCLDLNITQIVITHMCVVFNRRKMSLPICSKVQLYIARGRKTMFRLIVVKLSQKSLHLSLLSSTYPCELSVRKFFSEHFWALSTTMYYTW